MPDIVAITEIDGKGGLVTSTTPVYCHVRMVKPNEQALFSAAEDSIFLRHLTIFLLDKYFRAKGVYTHRHISMPLGEVYRENPLSIGMLTEYVYGIESSVSYNEHLDWNVVCEAFRQFGFTGMDHDLYSGFQGEADSISHNFFTQNELYPEEKKCVFSLPATLFHIPARYATARWMRIDYLPDSFPCEQKKLISELKNKESDLQKKLSPQESYFLNQYARILENKKVDDIHQFNHSIKQIRQTNLQEVLMTQKELMKRVNSPVTTLELTNVSANESTRRQENVY